MTTLDPEWVEMIPPGSFAPLLPDEELQHALDRLDGLGALVGHVPAEVTAWLVEILCRRDGAAAVLAQRLVEVAR